MVIVALAFIVLLVTSFIVFGVAFARIKLMPRWAGVGYAVSGRFLPSSGLRWTTGSRAWPRFS